MRRFYLVFLALVLSSTGLAYAQTSNTGSGSGVGADLLKQYQQQLNQASPAKPANNSTSPKTKASPAKPATPPAGSASKATTTSPAKPASTKPVAASPKAAPVNKAVPAKSTKAAAPVDAKKSRNSANADIGRNKLVQATAKAIQGRLALLRNENVTTNDIKNLVNYVQGLNMILKYENAKAEKPSLNKLVEKLSAVSTQGLEQNMATMTKTGREFTVLQEARREVGTEALAAAIDDAKNGGLKMREAVGKMNSRLGKEYSAAKTQEERDRIRKVKKMLENQLRDDTANEVMKATLAPVSSQGKVFSSGKQVASILESMDDEEELFDEETPHGARIIQPRKKKVK